MQVEDVAAAVEALGLVRGAQVGVALGPAGELGLATATGTWSCRRGAPAVVQAVEGSLRPRWVMWSNAPAVQLAGAGVRVAVSWDLAAVHRLVQGGWAAAPAQVWAGAEGLPVEGIPVLRPPDLFSQAGVSQADPAGPVRADGYLRPEWVERVERGGATRTTGTADRAAGPEDLEQWAALALRVAGRQQGQLEALADRPQAGATARVESTAELLCAEMTIDGLPVDPARAEGIIAALIGPRPGPGDGEADLRARRDRAVLAEVPQGVAVDLRSSVQVRTLLSRLGIEVADTRAWRLREVQDRHPVVPAFLHWRKAERMATTYGYDWLDSRVGDGRLRGAWTGADGAAGRMTASGGLHNMPSELRPAVVADPGHVFVRADLGQIEPRVLAVVSGDPALCRAATVDDLYAPVAAELGVDRAIAKVAVLGAMYGQTTGRGAQALRRLDRSYPVAMAYLDRAARAAESGQDLRTYGGRLVRMASGPGESPAQRAARGRYGRNAVIQGAAAELFKTWAVTVRARTMPFGARIVLCLHDELLVHAPSDRSAEVASVVADGLQEAVHRWAPGTAVRFVADVSVLRCWAEAKEGEPAAGADS